MLNHWHDDEKFQALLGKQNKKNRLSGPEGLGPSLHICGSIPISERKRSLVSKEHINKCIFDMQCTVRIEILVLCYI